eukprot:1151602-Pelagomonas_calceolata.AAC.10
MSLIRAGVIVACAYAPTMAFSGSCKAFHPSISEMNLRVPTQLWLSRPHNSIQSWEHPLMSSMVAAIVVACAYAPTMAFAGSCFAAALYMVYLKVGAASVHEPQGAHEAEVLKLLKLGVKAPAPSVPPPHMDGGGHSCIKAPAPSVPPPHMDGGGHSCIRAPAPSVPPPHMDGGGHGCSKTPTPAVPPPRIDGGGHGCVKTPAPSVPLPHIDGGGHSCSKAPVPSMHPTHNHCDAHRCGE